MIVRSSIAHPTVLAFVAGMALSVLAIPALGNELPRLDPIPDVSVVPGEVREVAVHATDPDGDALQFTTNFAPPWVTTITLGPNDGIIRLAPDVQDVGSAVVTAVAFDPLEDVDWATFTVTVLPPNDGPIAYAGGPYRGFHVEFDGTRSFDPLGSPLTYLWDFGDGESASGPTPVHDFGICTFCNPPPPGSVIVTLTVTNDRGQSSRGTTYVLVTDMPARVGITPTSRRRFLTIPGGPSTFCVRIQGGPNTPFDPRSIDLATVTLGAPALGSGLAPAIVEKTSVVGDTDGDGRLELEACFRTDEIAAALAALPVGVSTISFEVRGQSRTIGGFFGRFQQEVRRTGQPLAASASPNPSQGGLGLLTFSSERGGVATVDLFDARGRRVQTLLHAASLEAGVHEIPLPRAGRLSAGIYFYRVTVGEARATGKLVITR